VDGVNVTGTSVGIVQGNVFKLKFFPVGEVRLVKVIVSEDSLSSFDTQSIVSIITGSDAVSAVIGNQNKNIICDSLGTPEQGQFDFTTNFWVYQGALQLNSTGKVTFAKVSYTGGNSASYEIDTSSGLITIHSMNVASAEAKFSATVGGVVYTRSLFINKTKDGKTPVKGVDYNDGSSLKVQYSQNALTWHDTYVQNDVFIRIGTLYANGTLEWSIPQKYIPEKGTEYRDGIDGKSAYLHIKYSKHYQCITPARFSS
jgi:hypothetical protein